MRPGAALPMTLVPPSAASPAARPLRDWAAEFLRRQRAAGLAKRTIQNKESGLRTLLRTLGDRPIGQVRTFDLAELVFAEADAGKRQNARFLTMLCRELFSDAACAGWIDHNPALSLPRIRARVQRRRLTLEQWLRIHFAARTIRPWLPLAMELALISGQRRADIATLRYDQVREGYLWIEQNKRGARVALSLDLSLPALGRSLGDLIESSRDISSEHIIHHGYGAQRPGAAVSRFTLTASFAAARDLALGPSDHPPSFSEQRSLSARLYDESGMNPMRLLGHNRQATTDLYRDNRGAEWTMVHPG